MEACRGGTAHGGGAGGGIGSAICWAVGWIRWGGMFQGGLLSALYMSCGCCVQPGWCD